MRAHCGSSYSGVLPSRSVMACCVALERGQQFAEAPDAAEIDGGCERRRSRQSISVLRQAGFLSNQDK